MSADCLGVGQLSRIFYVFEAHRIPLSADRFWCGLCFYFLWSIFYLFELSVSGLCGKVAASYPWPPYQQPISWSRERNLSGNAQSSGYSSGNSCWDPSGILFKDFLRRSEAFSQVWQLCHVFDKTRQKQCFWQKTWLLRKTFSWLKDKVIPLIITKSYAFSMW